MGRGPVFDEMAGWLGKAREHTPSGSVTKEQQRETVISSKTLRAAVLLAPACVGSPVTARFGDAPDSPPWHPPKSPAAGPLRIFRQALSLLANPHVPNSSSICNGDLPRTWHVAW